MHPFHYYKQLPVRLKCVLGVQASLHGAWLGVHAGRGVQDGELRMGVQDGGSGWGAQARLHGA